MTWLLKIKGYLIALGSFLLALVGTYLWAKHEGKDAGESDQQMADIKAQADAIKEQTQTLDEVKTHVQDLPVTKVPITVPPPIPVADGAQQVGTAQSGTAAGDLKSKWMRD